MNKWEMVRLGDVCEIVSGTTPSTGKPELWGGDIRWITPAEIKTESYFIFDTERHISEKAGLKSMPIGTVLLSSRAPIGKVAIAGAEMCCNQGFKNLICSSKVHNRYLYRYLKNQTEYLNSLGRGATFKEISKTIVEQIKIPLPPLPIQQQIADVLDRASALIEKRKSQIEKLDLLVKSQFVEMFGDPVVNPKGWGLEKLSEIGELNRGVSKHRPRNDPKLLHGVHPLIQTGDIANSGLYITEYSATYSDLGLTQSKMWKKGTLCITIAANIAKTGILAFDSCFPDSVVGFVPNEKTNSYFIFYWFVFFQKLLEEQAPESAQKNINLKILSDLDVISPPITLQIKFADFVHKVETQKSLLQQSLAKMELNYKSLMQNCFRGEMFY